MMTTSPGRKSGHSICSYQARKGFAVHGTVEQQGRANAGQGQAADEGCGPVSVRDCSAAALPPWRPAAQTRHLRRQAAFIDEDQVLRIESWLCLEPILAHRLHIGAFLFARVSGLFLCVMPCRSRNFQTSAVSSPVALATEYRKIMVFSFPTASTMLK
jgi:hypothetical protein